jgi:hypothetical protein
LTIQKKVFNHSHSTVSSQSFSESRHKDRSSKVVEVLKRFNTPLAFSHEKGVTTHVP